MKKYIFYGVAGFFALILLITMNGANAVNNSADAVGPMMNSLRGKSGDDFDKAFIELMIIHHQDAIDMAEEAKKSAKHNELKIMADDIISTQSKEVNQLKKWQRDWGYK